MTDLVERLRDIMQYGINLSDDARTTCGQAADEIERLRAIEGPTAAQERDHLADQCAELLRENKRLRAENARCSKPATNEQMRSAGLATPGQSYCSENENNCDQDEGA